MPNRSVRSFECLSVCIEILQKPLRIFFKFEETYYMDTLVRMNADELNQTFLDFVKQSFKGKRIALHIYEDQMDETEYLLSDPVHKEKILKSVAEVNKQKELKTYTLDELKTMFLNEPEP